MLTRGVLLAGLAASLVMGMFEMLYEAVAGAGFWSPVTFIAATILRNLQGIDTLVPLQPVPVLLGLMGHMMNSVILGAVFALLIAPRLRASSALLIAGVVYGAAVFVVMWFAVVPVVDPLMLKLNGLAFGIAHVMWGAVLGAALAWQDKGSAELQRAPA
jgi:hypothetical protein